MKCIYASKLYKSSKRKDRISAALLNSSNSRLVQQLADSLDEEYKRPDLLDPESDSQQEDPHDEGQSSSEQGSSGGSSAGGGLPSSLSPGGGMGSFDPETDLVEFPEGEEGDIEEGTDGSESAAEELEGPDVGVQEATQIKACTLDTGQLNVLKDSLNLVKDIAGVTRIVIKDNELWIYYNDDMNLNNIMTDVIEYISKAYECIEFNRLARSDNAIVFELNVSTTLDQIS